MLDGTRLVLLVELTRSELVSSCGVLDLHLISLLKLRSSLVLTFSILALWSPYPNLIDVFNLMEG